MIFFCYLRGEPNAKTSYLHCSLVLCGKMQTVFSVQRHKKARTLSPVFCLTEPFSLPVTPNPPHVFILRFTLTQDKRSFVREKIYTIWKKTMSNLLWELQDFNIRILLNDWLDSHPKEDAILSWKTGAMRRLSYLFLLLCTTLQPPPSYLVKTMGCIQCINLKFESINALKQEKVIIRQAGFPRLKLWLGAGGGELLHAFIHILNERRDQ